MVAAIFIFCVLILAFSFPLALSWSKRSLYMWLIVWFGSCLSFFYLSQLESSHFTKAQNSTFVGLALALFGFGSLVRVLAHGISVWVRRSQDRKLSLRANVP